jgi:hypothetical protein
VPGLVLFAIALALPAESMIDMRTIAVLAIDRQSNDVIPPRTFEQSVVDKLQKAGVAVAPWEDGKPALIIFVGRGHVDLELRQPVALPSQPGKTFMGATWWSGGPMAPENMKNNTVPVSLIDDFLTDWRRAQSGEADKPRPEIRF